jgi:type IV pilus biogenesis protein CpaD/CtpE
MALSGAGSAPLEKGNTLMNLRIAGAVSALAAVALFGAVGCTNSEQASDATGTVPSVVQTQTLDAAKAQEILRTIVNPDTTPEAAAALVDSSDTSWGEKLHDFAQSASRGGYTPDKFTVKSVAAQGADKAVAQVEVASPHTPAPVTVPYTFDLVDGSWKLSAESAEALVGMGASRSHH